MERIYRERSNGQWEYWTYCDGERVKISAQTAEYEIRRHDVTLITVE